MDRIFPRSRMNISSVRTISASCLFARMTFIWFGNRLLEIFNEIAVPFEADALRRPFFAYVPLAPASFQH